MAFDTNVMGTFTEGNLTYYIEIPELDKKIYTITSCTPVWTQVAGENGSYNVGTTDKMCRYGADTRWNYGWKTGTVNFNNATWGDPASGTAKYGQVVNSVNLTISPTPTVDYTINILKTLTWNTSDNKPPHSGIYDFDGTINYVIDKAYDNDGITSHQISKVYDYDGTTSSLIYSADLVLCPTGAVPLTKHQSQNSEVKINSSNIQAISYNWDNYIFNSVRTTNKINITNFSKIIITRNVVWDCGLSYYYRPWYGITTNISAPLDYYNASYSTKREELIGNGTTILDISEYTGEYYLFAGGGAFNGVITEWRLE